MKKRNISINIFIGFITVALICAGSGLNASEDLKTDIQTDIEYSLIGLLKDLRDQDKNVRANAAKQLGKPVNEVAVDSLIYTLDHDDVWSVRKWAAWALGEIKSKRAAEALIKALKHQDRIIRLKAAEALGKLQDPRAVEQLIEALQDKIPIYEKAIWALGEICDDRAVQPLVEALGNNIHTVRINAAKALGKIQNHQAIDPLRNALQEDKIWKVRKWSAWAMGEIKDCRASESLVNALYDENYYVRMHAESALEKIKCPSSVPLLIAALDENKHTVYTRAVWTLEEITGQKLGTDVESWEKWMLENSGGTHDTQ